MPKSRLFAMHSIQTMCCSSWPRRLRCRRLFMVWLGIGSTSRITLAVFIVVATLTGLTSLDRYLLRLCKASGR